ncbi:MAG: G5 domain-containing protein [Bacilli bacterium]|nr:G5 domain-containing protein [Bacilli bacterium]
MKKLVVCFLLLVSCLPINIYARRGCCSHHGGVAGCSSSGRQICNDGSLSPTCTCNGGGNTTRAVTPSYIYGCTDSNAINYNPKANRDNGSCIAKKEGCMDNKAINYDASANTEDNSCQYKKQIVEKEVIVYKTKYKKNKTIEKDKEKVLKEGKNGEKEVTYEAIVDKDGNVISKEKKDEKVITVAVPELVEVGTKEPDGFIEFLWIISTIICFIYSYKNKDSKLLVNKIGKQEKPLKIILYVLYVLFIIPVFIDIVLIAIDITQKILKKQEFIH